MYPGRKVLTFLRDLHLPSSGHENNPCRKCFRKEATCYHIPENFIVATTGTSNVI
jgi:hypothetical protein